jgi:hypothetical protein
MNAASARIAARRGPPGTVALKSAIFLIVAATLSGLLLGTVLGRGDQPATSPVKAPQAIAGGGVRLQLPNGWTRGDAAAIPGFSHPVGLQNEGGLRASVERLPATSATLLPAAFLNTLANPPLRPDVVEVAGGRQAWRYRVPGGYGSMTVIYAAPTTAGVATVACTSPIDSRDPRACEALADAVTVPDSRSLAPAASAAFYVRVPSAVSDLRSARAKGLEQLAAATSAKGQAAAATGLADAHRAAVAALAPLTSPGDGAPSATIRSLTATASAYAALASAAHARLPQPYAKASRNVTHAEAILVRTMTAVGAAEDAATRAASAQAREPTAKPATTVAGTASAATATPAAQADGGARLLLFALGGIVMFALFLVVRSRR